MTKSCASCNTQWNKRKDISYKNLGSKSHSFISKYQLLSKFGRQRIELLFCDLHGLGLRSVTRHVNKTDVLQIRNIITNRWRNAEKVGDVVK